MKLIERDRERKRQRERKGDIKKDREIESERDREIERERKREREGERKREGELRNWKDPCRQNRNFHFFKPTFAASRALSSVWSACRSCSSARVSAVAHASRPCPAAAARHAGMAATSASSDRPSA